MSMRNMVVRNQIGFCDGQIGFLMTHGLGAIAEAGGGSSGTPLRGLRRTRGRSIVVFAVLLLTLWVG